MNERKFWGACFRNTLRVLLAQKDSTTDFGTVKRAARIADIAVDEWTVRNKADKVCIVCKKDITGSEFDFCESCDREQMRSG